MAIAPLDGGTTPVIDDVVVEPAAVVWSRRLAAELPPNAPFETIADRVAELVGDELRADHVALWSPDGDAYVVLGAVGFSVGARRIRLAMDFPVLNVCRATGGRLLRTDRDHPGPKAPGLPGSSSAAYAMVMLDDAGPVGLLTLSGRRLDDDALDAVCEFVAGQLGEVTATT